MRFSTLIFALLPHLVVADLIPLDDEDLSGQSGAGLGFAFENFIFDSAGADLSLTNIEDTTSGSNGTDVDIQWSELYVMGEGSANGTNPTRVNIGSYDNPWVVKSVRGSTDWNLGTNATFEGDVPAIGDDLAILQILTSRYTDNANNTKQFVNDCVIGTSADCASRAGQRRATADIGSRFDFTFANGRQYTWDIDIQGFATDGSGLWLWSRANQNGSELLGQLNLSLYAEQFNLQTCTAGCSQAQRDNNLVTFSDVYFDVNLGFGEIQPVKFSVDDSGNFELELKAPDPTVLGINESDSGQMQAFYDLYYANAPKSNIYIGDVAVGNRTSGGIEITGLRAQYLKVTTTDLR